MTVEEKAYNYASKVVKNRLTASEVAAHYGRGYIDGQEDMKQLGWHPASKPPKEGEEVMVMPTGSTTAYRAVFIDGIYYSVIVGKKSYYPSVEWWCYPPKE